MLKLKIIIGTSVLFALGGCAAISATSSGALVEVVTDAPSKYACKFLGDVYGSQGNWITGDITSNKNLAMGSRNDIKNEAAELGANVVQIQDSKTTRAWTALGTTNHVLVGKAYKCKDLK